MSVLEKAPLLLAIDTSCDETSIAVTRGLEVLSNVISSQVRQHAKFGGVVPMLAARLHEERIDRVVELALGRAKVAAEDIEGVAVTYGPGLAPALQVGIAKAKELAVEWNVPLYGINHMHGHLSSVLYKQAVEAEAPVLGLLVSGGHTEMVLTEDWFNVELLGETLDDAVGEAFDKVAKLLGLGYPGGKVLSDFADKGNAEAYDLPVPMKGSGDLMFSYSGLKNAVRLLVEREKVEGVLSAGQIADIAASFRKVAFAHLVNKVERALREHPEVRTVALAGGVAASVHLRALLRRVLKKHEVALVFPQDMKLCTDNGAMIGLSAYVCLRNGMQPVLAELLDRKPGLGW